MFISILNLLRLKVVVSSEIDVNVVMLLLLLYGLVMVRFDLRYFEDRYYSFIWLLD